MARLVARRGFMAGAAALAAVPNAWAQAQPTRFSALRVNAEPLAGRGAGAAAAAIERIMPEKLRIVFADLVSPGSKALPALVARIDTLSLTGLADTRPGTLYSMQQDTMSGAGLVVAGQTVLSVTPLHVNLPPGFSGTWYLPDIDVRRIDSLCYQFAYWLRREMQL